MIVGCPSCGAKYQYDESRFGEASTKHLKCSRCEGVFEVRRPAADAPVGATVAGVVARAGTAKLDDTTKELDVSTLEAEREEAKLPQLAPLPANRRYSLAVILGGNAGHIYPINKPRIVLGRGGNSDIQLPDSEVSRRHAMVEVRGDEASVIDLESTNGTFVDGVRVQRAELLTHQEFVLGTTTLMFIVTEVQEVH